jgi:hypothetical protein
MKGAHMKWISQKEAAVALLILVLIAIFGNSALQILSVLKSIGVDLLEVLLAGHVSFLIVKVIMKLSLGFFGIWIGKEGGKALYAAVLIIVGATIF